MENDQTQSGLRVEDFRTQIDGKETSLCILTNKSGVEVTVTNYGAKVVSLMVPDKNGRLTDVVTGHRSIHDYLTSEEPYFGAVCGRYGWPSTTAPIACTEASKASMPSCGR